MANAAIIWTLGSAIAAGCAARGLAMRGEPNPLAQLFWYSVAAFVLVGISLIWASLESEAVVQQRILLGLCGAIFGSLVAITVGEFIRPVHAQPQPPTPCIGNCNFNQSGGNSQQTYVNHAVQRHLTQEQAELLGASSRNACSQLGKLPVTAANSDREAQVYAMDFVNVLRNSECDASLALPIPGLTPDVVGLHVGVRDYNNQTDRARTLQKLLSDSQIDFQTNPMKPDFFVGDDVVLIVGAASN